MPCTYKINGRDLTEQEMTELVKQSMLNDSDVNYSMPLSPEEKSSPSTLKDLAQMFSNNTQSALNIEQMTTDQMVDDIYRDVISQPDRSVINMNGKEYTVPSDTEKDIRLVIRNNIIPDMKLFEEQYKQRITSFFQDVIDGGDPHELARQFFSDEKGQSRYSDYVIKKLIQFSGISSKPQFVMRYSDLKTAPSKLLRSLYKEDLIGYDPVVVIHQIDDKNASIDLSIVDPTSRYLGKRGYVSGQLLGSNFKSDSVLASEGMNVRNTEGDIRKALLGIVSMDMKRTMIGMRDENKDADVRFRNVGVLGIHRSDINPNMAYDMNDLVNNIRIMRDIPEFVNSIDNIHLRNVINDEEVYQEEYKQSYIDMLKNFFAVQSVSHKNDTIRSLNDQRLRVMLDGSIDQQIDAIKARMRYMERRMGGSAKAQNLFEYQILGASLLELESGGLAHKHAYEKMKWFPMKFLTAHNVKNSLLQQAVISLDQDKKRTVEEFRKYQKSMDPFTEDVIKLYETLDPAVKVRARFMEEGGKYFQRLYKKSKTKDGQDVVMPEIYWDKESDEVKRLISEGKLTESEIRYANELIERIEQRLIDNIYHENKNVPGNLDAITGQTKYTKEDARVQLMRSGYKKGMIPVIDKSTNELLLSGKIKKAYDKFVAQSANIEVFLEDNLHNSEVLTKLSDTFQKQVSNTERLKRAGLAYDGTGNLIAIDKNANENMSTNLEKIGNYFMISGIRKENYESNSMPIVNSINATFKMIDVAADSEIMKENKQWLKEYTERIIHQKTQDTGEAITVAGKKISVPGIVNIGLRAMSFGFLAYRPEIGGRSLFFNESQMWMTAAANSIAKTGYFGLKSLKESHAFVMNPKNINLIRTMTDKYQTVDRSEWDVVNNPRIVKSDKNLLQAQYGHIFNWITDAGARSIVMVAQMIEDGSLQAHSLDKEGNLVYDEKKDKRMYSNGKLTDKGNAYRAGLMADLKKDGVIPPESDQLDRGYSFEDSNNFKLLADKYIIGSMDAQTKSSMTNHYFGRMIAQFRLFSMDKLFNAGVSAEERQTRLGAMRKVIKDSTGQWISQREYINVEGQLQSLGKLVRAFGNMRNQSLSEWYKETDPITRLNIAKSFLATLFFTSMMLFAKGLLDDDDTPYIEGSWLYSDALAMSTANGIMKTPIPIYQAIERATAKVSEGHIEETARFVPGVRGAEEIVDAVQSMFNE